MSVSKINFNDNNEAYIVVEPISDIDREDFKNYLDLDSPSFLKCEFENGKAFTLYYGYGNRITLKQFLSRVVTSAEAITFLKSLTKVYMEAERYGLNTNHILLGINSIFYNEESREVSCIYIPAKEGIMPARPLRLFLKEMLVNVVYSEMDDMTWLGNTIRYISRNRQFSYRDFYDFLQTQEELDEEPDVEAARTPETEPEPDFEMKIPANVEKETNSETEEEALQAILPASPAVDSLPLQEEEDIDDGLGDLRSVLESIPAAESVNTLKFELKDEEEEVRTIEAEPEIPEIENPEITAEKMEIPEPVISRKDWKTGILLRRINQTSYPLEEVEIRIGKAADNDIRISDNPAVSRVHAIIRQFDGEYTIQDNGSTNHTFVNGIVLPEGQEKILTAGDRILLGNEEFIFKI